MPHARLICSHETKQRSLPSLDPTPVKKKIFALIHGESAIALRLTTHTPGLSGLRESQRRCWLLDIDVHFSGFGITGVASCLGGRALLGLCLFSLLDVGF